jgi:hypothetical protein
LIAELERQQREIDRLRREHCPTPVRTVAGRCATPGQRVSIKKISSYLTFSF